MPVNVPLLFFWESDTKSSLKRRATRESRTSVRKSGTGKGSRKVFNRMQGDAN